MLNHDTPPFPRPPFPLMPRGCIAKASLMFTNAWQKYHRSFADVSPTISANNQQLSPNVRRTLDYVGDALANIPPNHRKSIFSSELLVFYAQKSQGIGNHRVYNYTFHHRRCKNPQWDRGIIYVAANIGGRTLIIHCIDGETPKFIAAKSLYFEKRQIL